MHYENYLLRIIEIHDRDIDSRLEDLEKKFTFSEEKSSSTANLGFYI